TKPSQERLRIAGAVLTLVPADAERIRVSLKLPQTMQRLDRAGISLGQVTLGRQRIEAIWERRLDMLTRLEVKIDQLRGRDRHGHESLHLGTANFAGRLEENAGSAWSGAWSLDVSDFAEDGVAVSALNLAGKAASLRLF